MEKSYVTNLSASAANQPTTKLTKGEVLRKRKMSSLAVLNHPCVRNALLEFDSTCHVNRRFIIVFTVLTTGP
jgi:hypothetical protein